jgi:hypothetical protein
MSRHHLDRLLARGALSGQEREDVLARVLEKTARPARRSRVRPAILGVAGFAACAAVVTAVAVAWQGRDTGAFASRGGQDQGIHVEIACSGARLSACPVGSHLVFSASGAAPGYLTAWAEPVAGGERIWYFSAEHGAPTVPPTATASPLDRAVEIGPEHAIGKYVVHILVGTHPFSREQALRGDPASVLASETAAIEVVP